MKRVALGFLGGFFLGSAIHWIHISSPTPLEISLGQIIYHRIAAFERDINPDQVLRMAKDYASHKRPILEEKELYAPLMAIAEKNVQLEIAHALETAEKTLKQIIAQGNGVEVVPNRVYIEPLQEGSGERISGQDLITLQFKEYDIEGNLIKDTKDKGYLIPLSQTIKGFQLGLEGARVGEKRKLYIHPDYGFSQVGRDGVNQLLIYEVVITDRLPQ